MGEYQGVSTTGLLSGINTRGLYLGVITLITGGYNQGAISRG